MSEKETFMENRLTVALRVAKQSWKNTMPIDAQDAPLAIAILAAMLYGDMEMSE